MLRDRYGVRILRQHLSAHLERRHHNIRYRWTCNRYFDGALVELNVLKFGGDRVCVSFDIFQCVAAIGVRGGRMFTVQNYLRVADTKSICRGQNAAEHTETGYVELLRQSDRFVFHLEFNEFRLNLELDVFVLDEGPNQVFARSDGTKYKFSVCRRQCTARWFGLVVLMIGGRGRLSWRCPTFGDMRLL